MIQLSPDAQVETFRTILEMENRGQQLDDIFLRLKNAFVQNAGVVSLPDAVGALDELRWHLQQLEEQVDRLDHSLGIQRRKLKRPENKTRIDVNQLRGSTNTIRLPELVSLLASQQKTGTLRIKSRHGESFILELLKGAVVHVVSDTPLPSQMLGNILVAQDKLSSAKLKEFLAHYSPQTSGRIGLALAQAKLVDKSDLLDCIEIQARQLFQRIFALEDAVFCFTDGRVSDIELRVTMNTTHLLFEAARNFDESLRTEVAAAPELAEADTLSALDPTPEPVRSAPLKETAPEPTPVLEEVKAEPTPVIEAEPEPNRATHEESGEDSDSTSDSPQGDEAQPKSMKERRGAIPIARSIPIMASKPLPAPVKVLKPMTDDEPTEVVDSAEEETVGDETNGQESATDESPASDVESSATEIDAAATPETDESVAVTETEAAPTSTSTPADAAEGEHGSTSEESSEGTPDEPAAETDDVVVKSDDTLHAGALARLLGIQRKPAVQLILRDLNTIDALRASSDEDLLAVPGIGRKSVNHIRTVLASSDSK